MPLRLEAKLWLAWVLLVAHAQRYGHAAAVPAPVALQRMPRALRQAAVPVQLVMGCPCLDEWSIEVNGTPKTFRGCANPDGDVLPWCLVDIKDHSCNGYQGVYPSSNRTGSSEGQLYYDYCTTSRDVTNLGCLCKAVWELPGTNAMHGKPYHNSSGVIIGGKCADAPNPDGSAAGGPWCETVAKTCSNNPKASDVPTYSRDFDYCTSNTAYQAVRERLLPLDRAAAGGLPPIPDTPAYAFARREGVAALGGYISTTQSGCKCSPWSWTYFDLVTGAPNGSYIGCADPDPTHLTRGAWCPVDPRECPSYFATYTAGTGAGSKMIYFDYCGEVRQRTAAGCLCQGEWYDNSSHLHWGVCAVAPHWQHRVNVPWCTIDRSTCTGVPAGNGDDWHWDVCNTTGAALGAGASPHAAPLRAAQIAGVAVGASAAAMLLLLAAVALQRRRAASASAGHLLPRKDGKLGAGRGGSGGYSDGWRDGAFGGGGGGGGGTDGQLIITVADVFSKENRDEVVRLWLMPIDGDAGANARLFGTPLSASGRSKRLAHSTDTQ
ncbi:hypothetical protein MNEG_8085, partial [Monoraphidium neglectum]